MLLPTTFHRTFARRVSDYLVVAGEVEQFCSEHNLATALCFKIRLVLEELVLNLIDHGVGSVTEHVDLRINLHPDRIILLLMDDGDPFDPQSAPVFDKAMPLEERGSRGMGIHLVRSVAHAITYKRVGSSNHLESSSCVDLRSLTKSSWFLSWLRLVVVITLGASYG